MCNEKLRPKTKRSGSHWFDTISKQFGWERVYLSNFGFSANIIGIKNCGCLNHKANLMSVKSGWSANRAKFCTQVVDSDNLEHLIALSPFRRSSNLTIVTIWDSNRIEYGNDANGTCSSLEFLCVDISEQGFSTKFFAHKQLTQRIWNILLHCHYKFYVCYNINLYAFERARIHYRKNECFPLKKVHRGNVSHW